MSAFNIKSIKKIALGSVAFVFVLVIILKAKSWGSEKIKEIASPVVNPVAEKPGPPSHDKPEVVVVGKSAWRNFNTPPNHPRSSVRFRTHNPATWMMMMRDHNTNTIVVYPGTGSSYGPGIIGGEHGVPNQSVQLMIHPDNPTGEVTDDVDIYYVEAMTR